MDEQAKVWDKAAIIDLLDRNPMAVSKAVLAIYKRQTAEEQNAKATVESNGRGFTGVDAEFLSDIAIKLPRYDMRMTVNQLAKVRPKMRKYWRQLLEDIEAQGLAVSYKTPKAAVSKSLNPDAPVIAPKPVARPSSRAGDLARQFA